MKNRVFNIPALVLIEPGHEEDAVIDPQRNQHDEAEERRRPRNAGIAQQMDKDRFRNAHRCVVSQKQRQYEINRHHDGA
ncbi:hypothetical protein D3C71_1722600 [compost metagenome]